MFTQLAQAVLRARDPGRSGPFVLQQDLAIGPALAFLANQVLDGHPNILKMNFVYLVRTVDRNDRFQAYARCLHVDQQEADTFLPACDVSRGANEAKNPVRILTQRRPEFRPVNDEVIAISVRACFQRREVGACAWLGIPLAPPHIAFKDVREEARFLFVIAECVDDRANHPESKRDDVGRVRVGHLGLENVLLNRAPARAAVFHRPVVAGPALVEQRFLKLHVVFTRQRYAETLLFLDILRNRGAKKRSNLIAKGEFFVGVGDVHCSTCWKRGAAENHAAISG